MINLKNKTVNKQTLSWFKSKPEYFVSLVNNHNTSNGLADPARQRFTSLSALNKGTSAHNRLISYHACANYVSIGQHVRANCTHELLNFFCTSCIILAISPGNFSCFCWFSKFKATFERKIFYWRIHINRLKRSIF